MYIKTEKKITDTIAVIRIPLAKLLFFMGSKIIEFIRKRWVGLVARERLEVEE